MWMLGMAAVAVVAGPVEVVATMAVVAAVAGLIVHADVGCQVKETEGSVVGAGAGRLPLESASDL